MSIAECSLATVVGIRSKLPRDVNWISLNNVFVRIILNISCGKEICKRINSFLIRYGTKSRRKECIIGGV